MANLPVAGRFFEDIIDGYFPLSESLRQMLARQDFGAALVVITHAPVLHLPGDDGTGPVPMRLQKASAGLIRAFLGLAVRQGNGMRLTGVADWVWPGTERGLGAATRLAEPAFLRGIGLYPGAEDGADFGQVARDPASGLRLSGADEPMGDPHWGFARPVAGIERGGADAVIAGTARRGKGPALSLDAGDPARRRASDAMLADLAGIWGR